MGSILVGNTPGDGGPSTVFPLVPTQRGQQTAVKNCLVDLPLSHEIFMVGLLNVKVRPSVPSALSATTEGQEELGVPMTLDYEGLGSLILR